MTLFEKIIHKKLPANIIDEDQLCICIHDIAPQAKVHALLIPKKPIPSLDQLSVEDKDLLAHMFIKIPKIAQTLGLTQGYRVVNNVGSYGGQSVDHLHFHILGGEQLSSKFC